MNGKERFEKIAVDGIVIWRSAGVPAPAGARSLTIDLKGLFFVGKRLVVGETR